MVEVCFKARSEEGQLTEGQSSVLSYPSKERRVPNILFGTPPAEHALSHWSKNYLESMEDAGKNPRAGSRLKEWMDAAGFSRTEMEVIKLPTCGWAASRCQKTAYLLDAKF